jgi:spore photoproduct lyase
VKYYPAGGVSLFPDKIYYEPGALKYELGKYLKDKFSEVPWIPIENHNSIEELQKCSNTEFGKMKRHLIIGVRKTHKYVPNEKVSDFLVPYTSSGCSAMCLYCYLVCNYNKCSYLRLFVNREQMLDKLMRTANRSDKDLTFEIGSNSDLILENTITKNLEWTIEWFAKSRKGFITCPTKFDYVEPLLGLEHKGRTIIRVSVNPEEIIKKVEFGTSPLENRIRALNSLCDAGYRTGLLIAPVILTENWKELYSGLISRLADELSAKVKREAIIEIILMTYSYIHRAINKEAFPNAIDLYDPGSMTGRGRGRYRYKDEVRNEAEEFLREQLANKLKEIPILYIS